MYGQLDRLAVQVEMSPLMRTHGGLVLSREGKDLMSGIRGKYAQAVIAALDLEIQRSIAERGMQYTADLIDKAAYLARGDQDKFIVLLRIALKLGQITERLMDQQINPFGF